MKIFQKITICFLIILGLCFTSQDIFAQQKLIKIAQETSGESETPEIPTFTTFQRDVVEAHAGQDRNAIVNRQILFNADQSLVSSPGVTYVWNFGDGTSQRGITVSHAYKNTGVYRVVLEVRDEKGVRDTDEIIVTVTKDIIVMIADHMVDTEVIERLHTYASSQGILIVPIIHEKTGPEHIVRKEFTQKILEASSDIRQAKTVMFWTDDLVGINAFIDAYQPVIKQQQLFQNKVLVHVSESRSNTTYRTFQNVVGILKPLHLLIVPEDGVTFIVNTVDSEIMLRQLQDSGLDYSLLGVHTQRDTQSLGITNFLSYGVNFLVHEGVPLHNIYMILIIPIIATLIALIRQLIGIKTFGIYTPTLIALAFLSIGIWYGLMLFMIIMVVGTITRLIGKRLRFLYVPRMAILLIIVSLSIIATYIGGIYLGATGLVNVSILPILLLIILAENFIAAQMEKGTKNAIKLTLFTLIVSIVAYYFVSWSWFREVLLGYPELILLAILVNVAIGRWTGLRVLEYYRFRKLLS